jgi:hypothetical protein
VHPLIVAVITVAAALLGLLRPAWVLPASHPASVTRSPAVRDERWAVPVFLHHRTGGPAMMRSAALRDDTTPSVADAPARAVPERRVEP